MLKANMAHNYDPSERVVHKLRHSRRGDGEKQCLNWLDILYGRPLTSIT